MFTGLGTVGRLEQGVGWWRGSQVSSLRRTAEQRNSVIQSEAELNRQLSQIITCLSEAISSYVKLPKAISSQLFFPSGCRVKTEPNHPSECFYRACWWSSHRKILTYENLQQPTTTYD